MADYLDGEAALYTLLDGLQLTDDEGNPLEHAGQPLEPTTTFYELPPDTSEQAAAGKVLIYVYRAGWSDDQKETEGHDRVGVDVYGPSRDVVVAVSQGIEVMLVDNYHDVPGVGFIDDVRRDSRWRRVPAPGRHQQTQAIYRLISRPD